MIFSDSQREVVNHVYDWYTNSDKKIFRLFGYAGTGKTSIAKEIAHKVSGRVLFGAFTGKACEVLRSKGCDDAKTIHSLIYSPEGKSKQRLKDLKGELDIATKAKEINRLQQEIDDEKENLSRIGWKLNLQSPLTTADLLIVDECSMVGKALGEDLMSFGVKVLALGDPAQLPPVRDKPYFNMKNPDAMLTEVHRQALESAVYRWAMLIREGKRLPRRKERDDSWVKPYEELSDDDLLSSDVVIVGRNATRHEVNDRIREIKGFGERNTMYNGKAPFRVGERLICLKNHKEPCLSNGVIYDVLEVSFHTAEYTKAVVQQAGTSEILNVTIANNIFYGGDHFDIMDKNIVPFDYGYAITCHKSQGSQWGNVLVVDESQCFKQDSTSWLYTAITRASDVICIGKT